MPIWTRNKIDLGYGPDLEHPNLRTWAQQNRGRLIWAALTIIQSWIVAGRPLADAKLGMFESWSSVMGGILGHVGIRGFLDNLDQFYEESDAEGEQWRMLLAAWYRKHGDEPKKAGDLFPLAEQCDMAIGGNTDRAQRTRFGKMLGQQRDRTFTLITDEKHAVAPSEGRWQTWQRQALAVGKS